MPRHFNTAGPCRPELHYMLPAEARLPEVQTLIDRQSYFVIHAPRQVGKSTAISALASRLTQEAKYTSVVLSFEAGSGFGADVATAEKAVLQAWHERCEVKLPPELRPMPWPNAPTGAQLLTALAAWARHSTRPLVLFLDEIDSLQDQTLVSVLRQLRDGFSQRPSGFPWSLALVGMRDVRDYKYDLQGVDRAHSASPFNVKTDSLTLSNFSEADVAELYAQHTSDTGQVFEPDAVKQAFELTQGQPWLVNALARQATDFLVKDRSKTITVTAIHQARDRLIERQDTHLDSLSERLREPRVRTVIEPMLIGADPPQLNPDDIRLVLDLGLLVESANGLEIANPIYKEIIVRDLSYTLRVSLPAILPGWLLHDGSIDWNNLQDSFIDFWLQHGEPMMKASPYCEAAAHLVTMAFLYRICNGGGRIEREFAIGAGRLDLCVDYKGQKLAVELKTWTDDHKKADPVIKAKTQIAQYMKRIHVSEGWIILFDQRKNIPDLPDRCRVDREITPDGHPLTIIRL